MKIKIVKMSSKMVEMDDKFNKGKKRQVEKLGLFDGKNWYGCFAGKETKDFREGIEVEGNVTSREYNGKTYYDFHPLTQLDRIEGMLNQIVSAMSNPVHPALEETPPPDDSDEPPPDESLPF